VAWLKRAEQANRELAAGMAHEINNPLGVIIQGAQFIERRLSLDLPANRDAARRHQVALESMLAYPPVLKAILTVYSSVCSIWSISIRGLFVSRFNNSRLVFHAIA